jgi:hypothetical protein
MKRNVTHNGTMPPEFKSWTEFLAHFDLSKYTEDGQVLTYPNEYSEKLQHRYTLEYVKARCFDEMNNKKKTYTSTQVYDYGNFGIVP